MKYIFLIVFLILNFKAIAAENINYHCKAQGWNQNIKMSKELFLKTSNNNNRAVLVVNYKSFNQNQADEVYAVDRATKAVKYDLNLQANRIDAKIYRVDSDTTGEEHLYKSYQLMDQTLTVSNYKKQNLKYLCKKI